MSRAGAAMGDRPSDALEYIEQALDIRPHDLNALNAKGVVFGALGRFEDAAMSFRQAIAEQPMSPDLHYNLAYALQCQEKFVEALDSYNAALTLLPNYPEALNG